MRRYIKNETKFSEKLSLILPLKKIGDLKVKDLRDFQILVFKTGVLVFALASVIYFILKIT